MVVRTTETRICDVPSCDESARHYKLDSDDERRWAIDLCAGHFDIVLTLPWDQTRPSVRSEAAKRAASRRTIAAYDRSLRIDGYEPSAMG